MKNDTTELNMYVHDAARSIHQTLHSRDFHSRYKEVLERTIFGIIRKQRELGLPAEATATFLMHFLRTSRKGVEWHLIRYDISGGQILI